MMFLWFSYGFPIVSHVFFSGFLIDGFPILPSITGFGVHLIQRQIAREIRVEGAPGARHVPRVAQLVTGRLELGPGHAVASWATQRTVMNMVNEMIYNNNAIIYWLVALTILKNMSSSMGRMTSHILWKIKHVPNHQPVYIYMYMGWFENIWDYIIMYIIYIYMGNYMGIYLLYI